MKTKFSDIGMSNCEQRQYKIHTEYSEHGRSRIVFACPWCQQDVTAYVWSVTGGGKRCDCGAIFGGSGTGYKLIEGGKNDASQ